MKLVPHPNYTHHQVCVYVTLYTACFTEEIMYIVELTVDLADGVCQCTTTVYNNQLDFVITLLG